MVTTQPEMIRRAETVTVAPQVVLPAVVLAEPTYKILSKYLSVSSKDTWNKSEFQAMGLEKDVNTNVVLVRVASDLNDKIVEILKRKLKPESTPIQFF